MEIASKDEILEDIARDIVDSFLEQGVEFLSVSEHPALADALDWDLDKVFNTVNGILVELRGNL